MIVHLSGYCEELYKGISSTVYRTHQQTRTIIPSIYSIDIPGIIIRFIHSVQELFWPKSHMRKKKIDEGNMRSSI